jgi:hypothetical protein
VKDRYKIADKDFDKFLKTSKVSDQYLVQELERHNIKVQGKHPRLPNKDAALVDRKASQIEAQSVLGMACSVSQSWMLQYITSQLGKLEAVCKEQLDPEKYDELVSNCDLATLSEVSILAQDACLDMLDLQARQAAESKWIRRATYVDLTHWPTFIKNAVKRFPTVGDGSLCGPNLKDKLESYRLTSKALDVTEALQNPRKSATGQGKRSKPEHAQAPQSKRANYDQNNNFKSWKSAGRDKQSHHVPVRAQGRGSFKAPTRPNPGPSSG